MLLLFDLEMPAETLNVSLQRLVLVSQLRVEILMEVQVTLHISYLAVPEVELAALLTVVLLHEADAARHIFRLLLFFAQLPFHILQTVHHGLLVGIECGAETFGSVSLLLRLDSLSFELAQFLIDCLLLNSLTRDSKLVLLLSLEFNLLEVLEGVSEIFVVRAKLSALLSELIDLRLEKVHVIDHGPVAHMHVKQCLDPVVLLVEEVDLILELLVVSLVRLLLVLLGKLVHILSTLVKFTEAKDL